MYTRLLRQALGVALLAFSFVPIFRVLEASDETPFRQTSVTVAEATLGYVLSGAITAVLIGVLLAFLVPRRNVTGWTEKIGARVETIRVGRLALGLAVWGTVATWLIGRFLYKGFYTNVDEIASALQARYFALGSLAGDLPGPAEAWLIPNMMMVDAGWVSQFPPAHLVLMAVGIVVGAPMLVGPVLFGMMAGLSALVFPRLLPDSPRTARIAAFAVALSPFLLFIGAGALSHTSAGAFALLALYTALRARDGHWGWAVLAGASIGVMVSSRPWIGIVLGTLATLGIWLPEMRARATGVTLALPWLFKRSLGTIAGGVPFAVGLGWYNNALFGSPTTVGYLAAFGERHALGFHPDPWGHDYTIIDAVGFTSTDLLAFGTQLFETPLPVGAVIGVWLLGTRMLPRGGGFLLAWAFVPVVSNGLYWFHSTRMLYEATPAWLALASLAVAPLFVPASQSGPASEQGELAPDSIDASSARRRRLEPQGVMLWSVVAALGMGLTLGIPDRISSFVWSEDTLSRVTVPNLPDEGTALVFVHASWNERLSASLQGAGGMRQDSVISVLRRNTNCGLQRYALAREDRASGGNADVPAIDLLQLPGTAPDIVRPPTPEGTTLRTRPGETFPLECQREFGADRFGAVALAPLLWQGDLPGSERGSPLFVRDLGPVKNAEILAHYPDRSPWVFVPMGDGAAPSLVPYDEGMRVLWGVQ